MIMSKSEDKKLKSPFNSKQMKQLIDEYYKSHHISPKPGGWPGFTCFMTPRGEAILLPKITFTMKKKKNDEKEIRKLIENEILDRINCFDDYYLSSMIRYFQSDLSDYIQMYREDMAKVIYSNPSKFQKLFTTECEDSDINEALQRLLDGMAYISEFENLSELDDIWKKK